MTRDELINILRRYLLTDGVAQHALSKIWGQPFDGETERINTTKSASLTSPIPQTNPAPQKTQWTQQVIADVTTRERDMIRIMSFCKTYLPLQPTQPNQ